MEIRDARFEDLESLLELAHLVHRFLPEPLRSKPMDDVQMQRILVVTLYSDNGFAKVVEKDGKVIGCLIGVISVNQWGLKVAQDVFTLSRAKTRDLLEAFKAWAHEKDADVTHVTDLCGKPAYRKMIESVGFKNTGTVLTGV